MVPHSLESDNDSDLDTQILKIISNLELELKNQEAFLYEKMKL